MLHRALEGIHGLAQFRKQVGVRAHEDVVGIVRAVIGLAGVQIIAADLTKKICRFIPKPPWFNGVLPAAINRATISSCGLKVEVNAAPPSGGVIVTGNLFVQNVVGAVLEMALLSSVALLMACSTTDA